MPISYGAEPKGDNYFEAKASFYSKSSRWCGANGENNFGLFIDGFPAPTATNFFFQ